MIEGFRQKLTARMIAWRIAQATGEKVAERTISRRMAEWYSEQARRQAAKEQMLAIMDAADAGNHDAAAMIRALAMDQMMSDPQALTAEPLRLSSQALRAEELRLKREEMEIRRRAIELDEKKFAAMQEKQRQVEAALAAEEEKACAGGQVTAEDLRKIRELYGLQG